MATAGVLENEIVLQDLDAMARRAGFDEPAQVGLNLDAAREVPVSSLGNQDESGALIDKDLRPCPVSDALAWAPLGRRGVLDGLGEARWRSR